MSRPDSFPKKEVNYDEFTTPESVDPKIEVTNTGLKLSPYYFNFVFVTNFLPLAATIFLLFSQNNKTINIICWLLVFVCVVMILEQLRYYNTIIIDVTNQTIKVERNLVRRIINTNRIIKFGDVQDVNFYSTGARPSQTRYVIHLILSDGSKLRLISTNNKERGVELRKLIASYVKR